MEEEVNSVLNEFDLAIVVAKSCVWSYEENPGQFTKFPIRASRIIETSQEVNICLNLSLLVVLNLSSSFKHFARD